VHFLLVPIFSFLYRARGGLIPTGHTQLARLLFWAGPITLMGMYIQPYWGALCGLMAFLGLMIPNGSTVSSAALKAAVGQSFIGYARLLLILAPLAYFNPSILMFTPFGLLAGLAFYVGWKLDSQFGNAIGEWLTGAMFGLVFMLLSI
jgi:hypothetical protein